MNRVNRKLEYALMALKVMWQKRPGELTSAMEVVEKTGSPFDATARVLQQMAQPCGTRKEILRSEHGVRGGYALIRDLNKISLLDLKEIILGPMAIAKCLHRDGECELRGHCNIISPITTLNRKLIEFYQGLSVGELLRGPIHEATAAETAPEAVQ